MTAPAQPSREVVPPPGYRLLVDGEALRHGDLYFLAHHEWREYRNEQGIPHKTEFNWPMARKIEPAAAGELVVEPCDTCGGTGQCRELGGDESACMNCGGSGKLKYRVPAAVGELRTRFRHIHFERQDADEVLRGDEPGWWIRHNNGSALLGSIHRDQYEDDWRAVFKDNFVWRAESLADLSEFIASLPAPSATLPRDPYHHTLPGTCFRCRVRKIEHPNPDNYCPECLRLAWNFGAGEYDRVRDLDAKLANHAHFLSQTKAAMAAGGK